MSGAAKPPGSIESGVLIGHDGYLFLAGGEHDVSAYVTGKREVEPVNFEIFRRNVLSRAAWAAGRGARYLQLIMPDKQSIIPEVWPLGLPVRLGEVYLGRLAEVQPLCLYPAGILAQHGRRVTSRTDTHLSDYGSLLVATLLAETVTGEAQADMFATLSAMLTLEKPLPNDLGHRLDPPVRETCMRMSAAPPGTWLGNRIPGGNNGGVDLRFNPQARYRKCVVFFGDSFGRDVAAMLQHWFTEVYFFRTGFFHPEIATLCGPDIVITETVERYLDACVDDEERPDFLLYPYLGEKDYAPDKAFAEALSAVLSFPRPPYARYVAGKGLAPRAPRAAVPIAAAAATETPYDQLLLADPAEDHGVLGILEMPCTVARAAPAFVADLSGRGLELNSGPEQMIHGSYLVRRQDVLLFGPNHLVDAQGRWSCEARQFKQQFLDFFQAPFYNATFPGAKPQITRENGASRLVTAPLGGAITSIEEPVFLATPLEPAIWGRWIATVPSKIAQYRQYGAGRKFLCHTAHQWERDFLALLGVPEDAILPHDPGRSYICRDVMTVEYSETNMTVSALERAYFYEMVATRQTRGAYPRRLFVSRLSRSAAAPKYRVLQNEAELAARLEAMGFTVVEPEQFPFAVQIGMFAAAEQIVFLGGSAVYNAAFCAPGSSVITIESTGIYAQPHTALFASLGLRYGVIFGTEDMTDPQPDHRRWTLDLDRATPLIESFFSAA